MGHIYPPISLRHTIFLGFRESTILGELFRPLVPRATGWAERLSSATAGVHGGFVSKGGDGHSNGYGSKLGTPKLWMVNTKLD